MSAFKTNLMLAARGWGQAVLCCLTEGLVNPVGCERAGVKVKLDKIWNRRRGTEVVRRENWELSDSL